jgi:hypothetical protein
MYLECTLPMPSATIATSHKLQPHHNEAKLTSHPTRCASQNCCCMALMASHGCQKTHSTGMRDRWPLAQAQNGEGSSQWPRLKLMSVQAIRAWTQTLSSTSFRWVTWTHLLTMWPAHCLPCYTSFATLALYRHHHCLKIYLKMEGVIIPC